MRQKRSLGGCLVLLLLCFSTYVVAGDTCGGETCPATSATCNAAGTGCTCNSTACVIQFSHNSSNQLLMQVQIAGTWTTAQYVCVASGQGFSLQTADDFFFAKFASSPFTSGQTVVQGTPASAVNVTANSPATQTCYSFGAASCAVSASATGGGCGEHDPRIVIMPPGSPNAVGGKKK